MNIQMSVLVARGALTYGNTVGNLEVSLISGFESLYILKCRPHYIFNVSVIYVNKKQHRHFSLSLCSSICIFFTYIRM